MDTPPHPSTQSRVLFLSFTNQASRQLVERVSLLPAPPPAPAVLSRRACEERIGFPFTRQQRSLVHSVVHGTNTNIVTCACPGAGKTATLIVAAHLAAHGGVAAAPSLLGDDDDDDVCSASASPGAPLEAVSVNKGNGHDGSLRHLERDRLCVLTFHAFSASLGARGHVQRDLCKLKLDTAPVVTQCIVPESIEKYAKSQQDALMWLESRPARQITHPLRRGIVFCDEAQDCSPTQIRILVALQRWWDARIVLIGDKHQGIFSFADADSTAFCNPEVSFDTTMRSFTRHSFTTNFRSTPSICTFLVQLFSSNKTSDGETQCIEMNSSKSDSRHGGDDGPPVRLHAFDAYKTSSGVADLVRTAVRANQKVFVLCPTNAMVSQYQAYLLDELKSDGERAIVHHALLADRRVCIDTCHKSKGAEQDVVIVVGVDDDKFGGGDGCIDEALNLLYVACSRAKKELHLVTTRSVKQGGLVSRFLHRDMFVTQASLSTSSRKNLEWFADSTDPKIVAANARVHAIPPTVYPYGLMRYTEENMLRALVSECNVQVSTETLHTSSSASDKKGGGGGGGGGIDGASAWPIHQDGLMECDDQEGDSDCSDSGDDDDDNDDDDDGDDDDDDGDGDDDGGQVGVGGQVDDVTDPERVKQALADMRAQAAERKRIVAEARELAEKRAVDEAAVNEQLELVEQAALNRHIIGVMAEVQVTLIARNDMEGFRRTKVEQMALLPYFPDEVKKKISALPENAGYFAVMRCLRGSGARMNDRADKFEVKVKTICRDMGITREEWEVYVLDRWGCVWRNYVDYADSFRYGLEKKHGGELRRSLGMLYSLTSLPHADDSVAAVTSGRGVSIARCVRALVWVAIFELRYKGVCVSMCYSRGLLSIDALVLKYVSMWTRVLRYISSCAPVIPAIDTVDSAHPNDADKDTNAKTEHAAGGGGAFASSSIGTPHMCRVDPLLVRVAMPPTRAVKDIAKDIAPGGSTALGLEHTIRLVGDTRLCFSRPQPVLENTQSAPPSLDIISVNIDAAAEYKESHIFDALIGVALRACQPSAPPTVSAQIWLPMNNSVFTVTLPTDKAPLCVKMLVRAYIQATQRIRVPLDDISIGDVSTVTDATTTVTAATSTTAQKTTVAENSKRNRIESYFASAPSGVHQPPQKKQKKGIASYFSAI